MAGDSPVIVDPIRVHEAGIPSQPVSFDAARAARSCRAILAEGGDLVDAWRFGILQTIDYYTSYLTRYGVTTACRVFDQEPITIVPCVDAAFAAIAEHLAARDGWIPPSWVNDPARFAPLPWFVAPAAQESGYFHDEALRLTPPEFRRRNVYIGLGDLARA